MLFFEGADYLTHLWIQGYAISSFTLLIEPMSIYSFNQCFIYSNAFFKVRCKSQLSSTIFIISVWNFTALSGFPAPQKSSSISSITSASFPAFSFLMLWNRTTLIVELNRGYLRYLDDGVSKDTASFTTLSFPTK